MGGYRGQGRRRNYRSRRRRHRNGLLAARQRPSNRRGIVGLESGPGSESGLMVQALEAGQDSANRSADSRRARRGESSRDQDERRQGEPRKGDRAATLDNRADDLASLPVARAKGKRMARSGNRDYRNHGPRAIPETPGIRRSRNSGVPAK